MKPSDVLHELDMAGLRHPKILTLAITDVCNLSCSHCWVTAGGSQSHTHVPLSTLRRLVEKFAEIGGDGIRITGGEPLCHPHWLDILRFSHSIGFKTIILQTNAMLLSGDHAAYLRKLDSPGLSIQISLDGTVPSTHDLVRGKGTFNGALDGVMRLVREGLGRRISFFLTEMQHNVLEIPELLDLADTIGVGSVSTGAMVMCGRAIEAVLIAPPGVAQYLDLLNNYDNNVRFQDLYTKGGNTAVVEWRKGDNLRCESCTFIENPYITPLGRLYPCLLCHANEFSVTKVFEKGLAASFVEGAPLWASLQQISNSRADSILECHDCPGRLCCAGGCMGRAWGSSGDFLTADDRCAVRRTIYKKYGYITPPLGYGKTAV